jgi:hypothetical protein
MKDRVISNSLAGFGQAVRRVKVPAHGWRVHLRREFCTQVFAAHLKERGGTLERPRKELRNEAVRVTASAAVSPAMKSL